MNLKEGIRRLSLGFGIVAAIVFFLWNEIGEHPPYDKIPIIAAVSAVVGVMGWGLVRLAGWVIDGFRVRPPR